MTAALALGMLATGATADEEASPVPGVTGEALVEVIVPDRASIDQLVAADFDLAEYVSPNDDGTLTVEVFANNEEMAAIQALGFSLGQVIQDDQTYLDRVAEIEADKAKEADAKALAEEGIGLAATEGARALASDLAAAAGDVTVMRVDYFENYHGRFLEVEARTSLGVEGGGPSMAMTWDSGPGTPFGPPVSMGQYNDPDVANSISYMFHVQIVRIAPPGQASPPRPDKVRVASSAGGVVVAPVNNWLGSGLPPHASGYLKDMWITRYLDTYELYDHINALNAEFPDLTEVIDLPSQTAGYQRKAMATMAPLSTSLSVAASAGSTGVRVASTSGLTVGAQIAIEPGPNQETRTVTSLPTGTTSPASNVLLNAPLTLAHASGSVIFHGNQGIGNSASTAAQNAAVVLSSVAMGHLGGEQLRAEFRRPGAPNAPLNVAVVGGNPLGGSDIVVDLATNANGEVSSTAAQVVAAINASAASALVTATGWATNAGSGVAQPRALVALDDFLNAPASVPRGPITEKMLRIGKHRDGSKVGIFLYCNQHAREWTTPVVCLETAYRLLKNYSLDPATTELVDNLDIFIIPTSNPDGNLISRYDFNSQRRNMTNYCAPTSSSSMPSGRNTWGVDLNRNSGEYSGADGYAGASTSCTSDVFRGPFEYSEPEIKNEKWVTDTFTNIKFANNIHSHGGYFMWAPGSYITAGRVTAPAPNIGIEAYFFQAGDTVLTRIKEERNTVILPQRTGPIADVLYSAAGNSADDQWYRRGIISYSFETGAERFDPNGTTGRCAVGFFPNFEAVVPTPPPTSCSNRAIATVAEGRGEMNEFAAGNFGLLESALAYARDTTAPDAQAALCTVTDDEETCTPTPFKVSTTPLDATFKFINEPSVIHYTMDGSTPSLASQTWEAKGPRQPGIHFDITAPTYFQWVAVDIKGNVAGTKSALYVVGNFPVNSGLLPPVGGAAKSGSTVPVKFSLGQNYGLLVLSAAASAPANCSTGAVTGAYTPLGTAGGSDFRWDAGQNQYVYNWKSEKGWSNTCRQLQITLADTTVLTALVRFTK
jgi:hypothetical protein